MATSDRGTGEDEDDEEDEEIMVRRRASGAELTQLGEGLMNDLIVYAADIGSVQKDRFGWCLALPRVGGQPRAAQGNREFERSRPQRFADESGPSYRTEGFQNGI